MKVYLVGGAIRDQLLGLPVKERDWVVVGASPEQMLALGYRPVGKDFPVFLHPQTNEEYALARTERKSGPGYKGFTFNTALDVTLEDDLRRRDITINAIAQTPEGELCDPFGGLQDLQNKIIRHVSEAFIEDPVRILRVARFAARFKKFGFSIAPDTMRLMQTLVANGEVAHLVPERVWQELRKALEEDHPSVFFEVLHACHADAVIFPEISHLYGVPNPARAHPEIDTGIHTLLAVDKAAQLTSSTEIRFAVLAHDFGKALTPSADYPHHYGHEHQGITVVENFCQRLRVPAAYKDLAVLMTHYHGQCHRILEAKPSTLVSFLEKLDAFRRPDRFKNFLIACQADYQGRKGREEEPYPQAEYLLKAYEACASIKAQDFLTQGFTGLELANKIHQTRIEQVKHLLKD